MIYPLSSIIFVISVSSTLPQLYQTITTNLTRDLSLWSLVLNILTNILLSAHGVNTQDTGLFGIGAWFTLYWSTLLYYKWKNVSVHSSL